MTTTRLFAYAAIAALAGLAASARPQGPRIRTLTEQEVEDLMTGSSIQGTRAADSARSIETAKQMMAAGKTFQMISVDDLPDDWTAVEAAGGIGGGGAWEYVTDRIKQQNLPVVGNDTERAMEALSKYIGRKFNAVLRNEADGATLAAFTTAIAAGLPVVDACPAGRAKPEVQQSVTFLSGIPAAPAVFTTRWGDIIILSSAVDDYRFEDIARALAVASGGGVSQARNAMSGRDVKRGTIHGALSEAILFGKTVREARAQGKDPIAALLPVAKAYKLFQGVVTKAEMKGDRGFTWWDVEMRGVNQYQGHTYRVFVKNENIVSWLDGKPHVMSPDLLYNLDPKTGDAVVARAMGGYPMGQEVVMIGRPAPHPAWRTPKGIDAIGPRHFGFDFDYVPIEQVVKASAR
jgi:DUF917 family protein